MSNTQRCLDRIWSLVRVLLHANEEIIVDSLFHHTGEYVYDFAIVVFGVSSHHALAKWQPWSSPRLCSALNIVFNLQRSRYFERKH